MTECKFKVGDRVRGKNTGRTGVVSRADLPGKITVDFDNGEQSVGDSSYVFTLVRQAPATTAAVEPPRAFVVGDVVRHRRTATVYTVAKVSSNGCWLTMEGFQHVGSVAAAAHTLVAPAAPAEPAWVLRERPRMPEGWTLTATGRPLLGSDEPLYTISAPDGRSPNMGAHLSEGDMGYDGIVRWVKQAASILGIPDPYAAPTIDGQAAVLPPTPYCSECGEELGMLGAVLCGDCCEADHGCDATHEERCEFCLSIRVGHPAPDLSLTNEIGFPVMPKHKPTDAEVEAMLGVPLRKPEPARPVPQCGDVVEWEDLVIHRGLVVPADGNGNKPRSGYLWARRKFEGVTAYACVAVDLCAIVERAGDR